MPRTFAYVRVSTPGQTTDNQVQETEATGFGIEPRRVVAETISGSVAAARRGGFGIWGATERKTYVRNGSSVLFLVGAESLSHVTATDSDTGQRELGGNAVISHAR